MGRPRWLLHVQAHIWRGLMAIGMFMHRIAPPRPSRPNFSRVVPTSTFPQRGTVRIQFYVPKDYETQRLLRGRRYPVVVNFHGGGFTLGSATDDARWANVVVQETGAVVASVDYRLAPEYPFPTAVEDGADAVMYLVAHADELRIDTNNIALSGFSSGGNMAFTVPLRLQQETDRALEAGKECLELPAATRTASSSDADKAVTPAVSAVLSATTSGASLTGTSPSAAGAAPGVRIKAICSWYPSTDYTQSREQRKQTNARKDQELSAVFTHLFDESYLQPPTLDMASPFLSPGVAPQALLAAALPHEILLYTCEWDMLQAEGARLRARLLALGKRVHFSMVAGVPHAWDKAPNPFKPTPGVKEYYLDACAELRRIFRGDAGCDKRRSSGRWRRSLAERRRSFAEGRRSLAEGRTSLAEGRRSLAKDDVDRRKSVVN